MALARSDYLNALVSTYKFEPPEEWYNKNMKALDVKYDDEFEL